MTVVHATEREQPARPSAARRPYDSTLRRQRAAETRGRIIAAGSELLHGSSVRDWHGLTIRAVAERAGVNERTVYRHFANERALRDAVIHRLEQHAGVDLAQMQEGRLPMRELEEARVAENAKWIALYDAQYALEKARWNVLRLTGQLTAGVEQLR